MDVRYRSACLCLLSLSMALLVALAGCQREPPVDSDNEDASWSHFVSGRTAGVISRADPLRIRFMNDVVPEDEVGKPVQDRVELSPDVEVEVVFTSRRELVVTPKRWLESGQHYTVVVNTDGLAGFPADRDDYRFTVQVMPQALELRMDGVGIEPGNEDRATVSGWLETADRADNDAVAKTLRVKSDGQQPALRWEHGDGGRQHRFVIGPLVRGEKSTVLILDWDGAAIGVEGTGSREVAIPARGEFLVTGADVVRGTEEYIAVDFSQPLDTAQNLAGLVTLSSGEITTRVTGSRLKVYPRERPTGDVTLSVAAGIRSGNGKKIAQAREFSLTFEQLLPAVEFTGNGVILPTSEQLVIPFSAVNLTAVQVTALRIYDDNVGQFLQVNTLSGQSELKRVGRYLWKKTVPLTATPGNRWGRYALDVSDLLGKHPGEIYQLTLSFDRRHIATRCGDDDDVPPPVVSDEVQNGDEDESTQASGWDFAEDWYGEDMQWSDRENPCKQAFYRFSGKTRVSRNFLASNIGLLAKRGSDGVTHVVATDLRAGAPLGGVALRLFNFQGQPIAKGDTDSNGMAALAVGVTPLYLEAGKGAERGYLKLSDGVALPTSHFDVGGEQVRRGVKGALYGERGVWRPGDDIHLVLALHDPQDRVPDTHPATLELLDPQGKVAVTVTSALPVGNFYTFTVATAESAPTGTWRAKAHVGGLDFEKTLKIETVMPNRLKLELDTGKGVLSTDGELRATLDSQWLHGAPAAGLKADVKAKLVPRPTAFTRYADFIFDDPAREFTGEDIDLFEGQLDAAGHAVFSKSLAVEGSAPGLLRAQFTSRVFEPGGAFSTGFSEATLSPYEAYVGVRLPAGDRSRNMLLTDTAHVIDIATLNADGAPVSVKKLEVSVYKVEWRWWWDKSGDSLARYASGDTTTAISRETVSSKDGRAQATFEIKYPDWGRYLVRVCDEDGGHCTGRTIYVDWPGWAGRAQEQRGPGASALTLWTDKPGYSVGDTATVHLPPATKGRALLSVENGSRVVSMQWLEISGDKDPVFTLPVTADMTPNVYVHVTLLQPHAGKGNDRPLRLYGVLPLPVDDPQTKLSPIVQAPDVIRPEAPTTISVREEKGRAMSYTLAVVDEGLLGLTSFRTPDLRAQFYQREALGVRTWDLFDEVVGAYGGTLERILAIGGSDALARSGAGREQRRFPPVVKFIGAFQLKAGETRKHDLKLPPYVGAVRVMAVAGQGGAWGFGDKTVTVRAPLMVQATVPRVLGPDEAFTVPVSVWALEDSVRAVQLSVETDDLLAGNGATKTTLTFTRNGDQLGFLALKAQGRLGKTKLRFVAISGKERAEETLWVDVRAPNPATTVVQSLVLKPGEKTLLPIKPHGLDGTQSATLELSTVPPLNLGRRLDDLIGYPHGCVEQTTSRAFPQVYLSKLLVLDEKRATETQNNVKAAIGRLREFQRRDGAFSYWPYGGWYAGADGAQVRDWSSSYVGHFLLEAQRAGYQVPLGMLGSWQKWQRTQAQRWTAGGEESTLDQAYRLYTLALAGDADVGAMNRLGEQLGARATARWMLAAAYQQAGMPDAARRLISGVQEPTYDEYRADSYTYGSALRDRALVLLVRQSLGDEDAARKAAEAVSAELMSDAWLSTQSTAWSLVALAQFGARPGIAGNGSVNYSAGKAPAKKIVLSRALAREVLPPLTAGNLQLENTTGGTLYASVVQRGIPPAGDEQAAANGLQLSVMFADAAGKAVDPARLVQGSDIKAVITVRNVNEYRVENLALTAVAPSGWEIRGGRLTEDAAREAGVDYRDTRDDRVLLYFPLDGKQQKTFTLEFNAAYLGRFYLPAWSVAAMYDGKLAANSAGRHVEIVPAEK